MVLFKKHTHVIFWSTIFIFWLFWVKNSIGAFEYFINNYKNIGYIIETNNYQVVWYILISLTKFTLIILISYRIIPTYGFQKKAVYRTLFWTVLLLVIEWGIAKILYHFLKDQNLINYKLNWNYNLFMNVQIFIGWAIFSWILSAAYKWFINYEELKKLHQNRKSYIQLKEQLNPHFIFNTLNSLYELSIQEKNEKLQEGILDLTETIRYTIDYSDKNLVSLNKEINAIKSYIALQKRRLEISEISVTIDDKLLQDNLKITPLLLLSYVENAFKHGYNSESFSEIIIKLKKKENGIFLKIKNTNHAITNNIDGGNKKNKSLLDLNYPNKYNLKIINDKNVYVLKLWMNLS